MKNWAANTEIWWSGIWPTVANEVLTQVRHSNHMRLQLTPDGFIHQEFAHKFRSCRMDVWQILVAVDLTQRVRQHRSAVKVNVSTKCAKILNRRCSQVSTVESTQYSRVYKRHFGLCNLMSSEWIFLYLFVRKIFLFIKTPLNTCFCLYNPLIR